MVKYKVPMHPPFTKNVRTKEAEVYTEEKKAGTTVATKDWGYNPVLHRAG